jgi:sucrose-6-phosphate hydrolase SacC (GH32 family)
VRLGRFVHGHYKLCHLHHPDVPSNGKITWEHIDAAV